jgi:hypothetical protein
VIPDGYAEFFQLTNVAPIWVTGTVEDLRDRTYFKAVNPVTAADGTLPYLRYSISRKGEVGVAVLVCAACHTRVLPDGKIVTGAPGNHTEGRRQAYNMRRLGEEEWKKQPRPNVFIDSSVPWLSPNPAERLKTLSFADSLAMLEYIRPPGVFPRPGASWLYPVKVPDLIGIRDRKYLDATGLNQHRGIGDLMRYGALVNDVERYNHYGDFSVGSAPPEPPTRARLSDAQLYALSLYIYSLKPPENPNKPSALT